MEQSVCGDKEKPVSYTHLSNVKNLLLNPIVSSTSPRITNIIALPPLCIQLPGTETGIIAMRPVKALSLIHI